MLRAIFYIFITSILIFSCKNDKTSETSSPKQVQTDIEPQKYDDEDGELKPVVRELDIVETRNEAKNDILTFLNGNNKASTYLTLNYYIVDYISDGSGGPKDMIDLGEWYKFEKDFSYKHGFFEELKDEGQYSYDMESKKLLMLPTAKEHFPSEWKILNSGDIIVLVGTARFNNNSIQKHMQNIKDKPIIQK